MSKQLYNECADIQIKNKTTDINREHFDQKTGRSYRTVLVIQFILLDVDGKPLEAEGQPIKRQSYRSVIIDQKTEANIKEVLVAEQAEVKNFINNVSRKYAGKDIISKSVGTKSTK